MFKWLRSKCLALAPPFILKWKKKHPWTFWIVMATIIILPMSPVTIPVLHFLNSVWVWLFAVK
jgi:hypothetical protein